MTIAHSVFDGNVPLFFKVTGNFCSEEYVALAEEAILLLKELQKQRASLTEELEGKAEGSAKDLEIGSMQEKIRYLTEHMDKLG